MKSIRIKNFRSIVDSKDIQINRINLLLGKNSSGKSSFIRLFPMLKQSIINELRGPILWFDDSYDFGTFSNTISRYAKDKKIMFGFKVSMPKNKCKSRKCSSCFIYEYKYKNFLKYSEEYNLNVFLSEDEEGTFVCKVEISTDLHKIELVNKARNSNIVIIFDDKSIDCLKLKWDYTKKGILPRITYQNSSPQNILFTALDKNKLKELNNLEILQSDYKDLININSFDKDEIYKELKRKSKRNLFIKFLINGIDSNNEAFDELAKDLIVLNIVDLFQYVDKTISADLENTHYMMPLRYCFSRYIRNKELAIDNIDSTGKNVMEFILSLNDKDKKDYISYLEKSLEIDVMVDGYGENKSIYILKDGEKDNIVDVGYGFSQILPIATILWDIARKQNKCEISETIEIEQPEVHLHPSMQANLVKLFVNALDISIKKGNPINLLIETHSPAIVNKLGQYIRENEVSKENVSVYLFEKENGITNITSTSYDNNGRIQRWPIGFLD